MRRPFQSDTIGDRIVHISLPQSYAQSQKRYPVVYMQDGADLAYDCFNLLEHKFMTGELPELILVGIEPLIRNDDYTPWPAKSLTGTYADFGGKGDDYLEYLTATLKPHIDQTYRTESAAAQTGIIGASFGGMISLYAAFRKPDVFGRIGALSPSVWYERFLPFVQETPLPQAGQKIYMSIGNFEGIHKTNIQRNMVPFSHDARRALERQGLGEDRLRFEVEERGTHDQVFFVKHFVHALAWLFQ
ncbi:alpha/beta hydrolase [Paenibacillus methanolicus]|uniref:Putative alpha/beta superfamily hydrolase n=1 Tax=Paenibacillus methanolicus TaxID=582686 RepID=A0A5S5C4H0_9BACL|nr:alpha/beta hydrolase-fold protein [Paenibacillus methanolicus]TYP74039.1 putative alpha/beta superfamily hydrolase [Paenibacillus methanolicus]